LWDGREAHGENVSGRRPRARPFVGDLYHVGCKRLVFPSGREGVCATYLFFKS
jgi:hypothetical protein